MFKHALILCLISCAVCSEVQVKHSKKPANPLTQAPFTTYLGIPDNIQQSICQLLSGYRDDYNVLVEYCNVSNEWLRYTCKFIIDKFIQSPDKYLDMFCSNKYTSISSSDGTRITLVQSSQPPY